MQQIKGLILTNQSTLIQNKVISLIQACSISLHQSTNYVFVNPAKFWLKSSTKIWEIT